MKQCKKCLETKCLSKFSNGKSNPLRTCRDCRNKENREKRLKNIESTREKDKEAYQRQKERRVIYAREYRKLYPDRTRETNLKSKYGITQKIYEEKLEDQKGMCAICGRHNLDYGKKLCIDHNHQTGEVRGLLCDPCNYGLGFYEKHKEKYIKYLIQYPK